MCNATGLLAWGQKFDLQTLKQFFITEKITCHTTENITSHTTKNI